MWILWIICVGVLHLFGNNFGTIVILTASVVLPFVSWIAAVIMSKRANIILELPDDHECTKGGEVKGYIKFSGGRFFSCILICENLFTGEITKQKVKINKDNKDNKIAFLLETLHCGVIRATLSDLRVFDMFGLFPVRVKKNIAKTVAILPEIFDISIRITENINAASDNGEYSITKSGTNNSEIYAIREYVPGDPVKNIHWKLSEKTDRLMVRDFGTPAENKVLIIFEKSISTTVSELDNMAEILFSLSRKLSKENIRHDILWKENKSKNIKKYSFYGEITIERFYMEFLSESPCSENIAEIYLDEQRGKREYSHAIIVSPNTLPETLEL